MSISMMLKSMFCREINKNKFRKLKKGLNKPVNQILSRFQEGPSLPIKTKVKMLKLMIYDMDNLFYHITMSTLDARVN